MRYYMCSICKKSGVKPIRVHDLRHSHASFINRIRIYPTCNL
ncbi:hypothetical protein CNEO4_260008 [Clostridium neonatale]|nr:hypothetical protein CNEO2_1140008 [Clostridium neonatale]CAI3551910.1 hypothetical protein CNEO3_1110008 [Clostridium neonatale]CAI3554672.1 hypothetical protein CNEO2_1030005 [Clostridium neonatale]CAI3555241.1 hypothetical protein CNEO2_1030008 [Clostridium neonatale]CAI3580805.1 hypothetical protein CNEO4_1510005 [Clostridium neonatale]